MKFRPLRDRVLVKRVEAEEKTKGGIRLAPAPAVARVGGSKVQEVRRRECRPLQNGITAALAPHAAEM